MKRETVTKGTATYTEFKPQGLGAQWDGSTISQCLTAIGMSFEEELQARPFKDELKERFETSSWNVIYMWDVETEAEINGGYLINSYFYVPKVN